MDKRAISTGFLFIVVLIVLMVAGLGYIALNQVYVNYLYNQTTINQVVSTMPYANASAVTQAQTTGGYFWYSIPVFIIGMLILYIIVKAQSGGDGN